MPEYRRAFQPGGTFFITIVTERRARILIDPIARQALREAFKACQAKMPFTLDAITLLPDHLHLMMTLPNSDPRFSARIGFIKKEFTKRWLFAGGYEQPQSQSRETHRRRGVWQRRFWEHTIRDDTDFIKHCDYIHYNPVKHGVARCPHAWAYSSFRRFVKAKRYDESWQCVCRDESVKPPDFSSIEVFAME